MIRFSCICIIVNRTSYHEEKFLLVVIQFSLQYLRKRKIFLKNSSLNIRWLIPGSPEHEDQVMRQNPQPLPENEDNKKSSPNQTDNKPNQKVPK